MLYKLHGLYFNIACTLHCAEINLENQRYVHWIYTQLTNKISTYMFRHSMGAILRKERKISIYSLKDIKLRLPKLPDDGTCGVPKHVGGDFVFLLCIYVVCRL